MNEVRAKLNELIAVLKDCDNFKNYRIACEEVEKYPEKAKRLHEFRKKNYLLQNSTDSIDLFSEVDRLSHEYGDLFTDPVTGRYLDAEVALCKILQQLNREIIECIDFRNVLDEA